MAADNKKIETQNIQAVRYDQFLKEAEMTENEKEYFVRFSINQRVQHIVLMITFIALAVTGLAQRFYSAGWAEWTILHLGGIENTRLIHRTFGYIFTFCAIYHFAYLAYSLFIRHAKPSMMPNLKDIRDIIDSLKYGFGFTDKHPQCGRFDYRQKFEYWGLIFGSIIITFTGYTLIFPVTVTRILPGQFVAAAAEIHGYEATLAVIVIIIWHFYDVIFRPGVFPADTTIFTGRISRERMIEEHPLEYAELMEAEAVNETRVSRTEELSSGSSSL